MAPAQHNPIDDASQTGITGGPVSDYLNVLVNFPLEEQFTRRIEALDPRIRVRRSVAPPSQTGEEASGASDEWRQVEGAELDALLAEANVLFTFRFSPDWLSKAPNLKWIQLASAGSDFLFRAEIPSNYPGLTITTSSGVHAVPISEHIVAMILYFSRGFDRAARNQAARKWERQELDEAQGKTVLLVGYGPIARRAASLCAGMGMRVLAVRASLLEQQPGLEGVERFYPPEDLDAVLSESDYVVVAAPRTSRSEGMIGREQFASMKQGAVLINISRGALVDEAALIDALQAGKLRGAGLDVFSQEPLPESSLLWEIPNVLITPHVSGSTPHYYSRATDIFCQNLVSFLRGEPLKNLVLSERGY